MNQPMNVRENFALFDTVGIYDDSLKTFKNAPGWYANYAAMGAAPEVNFFNARNRRIGLPYCNLDSIDKMAYGFRVNSLGIAFFANQMTQAVPWVAPPDHTWSPEDTIGHLFMAEIPKHAGFRFRVVQDDVLYANTLFAPAGFGPFGDGYGRGSPSQNLIGEATNGFDHHLAAITQGIPAFAKQWQFGAPLEIPRDATINIKITFSEYARQMLQAFTQSLRELFGDGSVTGISDFNPTFAGIVVMLIGDRLVQQRGELHR